MKELPELFETGGLVGAVVGIAVGIMGPVGVLEIIEGLYVIFVGGVGVIVGVGRREGVGVGLWDTCLLTNCFEFIGGFAFLGCAKTRPAAVKKIPMVSRAVRASGSRLAYILIFLGSNGRILFMSLPPIILEYIDLSSRFFEAKKCFARLQCKSFQSFFLWLLDFILRR